MRICGFKKRIVKFVRFCDASHCVPVRYIELFSPLSCYMVKGLAPHDPHDEYWLLSGRKVL